MSEGQGHFLNLDVCFAEMSSNFNSISEQLTLGEQQLKKINEVRKLLGTVPEKLAVYCSDASISRYLRARNWHAKKATKMVKETLKWRHAYKPEEIHWEDVANEAVTGKIYRSNYTDKHGRTVLVMRPSCQNTKSSKGQIKYLVYCMENAILNLPPNQEQMVWLIDFHGFNAGNISVKVTRETARVLQDHYPERLGLAILYDPPKIFESFWSVVRPFLEPKTYSKVKFVYPGDLTSKKIMGDLFDMDKLEGAFGGNCTVGFDFNEYAERMKEDDKRKSMFCTKQNSNLSDYRPFDSAESESDDSRKGHDSPDKLCYTNTLEDASSKNGDGILESDLHMLQMGSASSKLK